MSERKRIESDLAKARDAALQSVRLKSEFLANMSHEIRTPMNGVVGMTGLLLDSPLTPERREFAETIRNCGDSLLTIIDDILDLSKIEAGMLNFEHLDFDLRSAVEGVIDLFAPRANGKGLELVLSIQPDLQTLLRGDPGRVRQVLTNLLGNAVKFTEKGEIVVRVNSVGKHDRWTRVRFEVEDTGIGISEEAVQRLFQPFSQADGSTTRKYGGTGLGLAISRKLVEIMKGEIGVHSQPGKGSTFWFTAEFEQQPVTPDGVGKPKKGLDRARVLVVDDNATNLKVLHYQMSYAGIHHDIAHSGKAAMQMLYREAAQGTPYNLLLTDMQMPEMDGWMLTAAVHGDPAISATRIIR